MKWPVMCHSICVKTCLAFFTASSVPQNRRLPAAVAGKAAEGSDFEGSGAVDRGAVDSDGEDRGAMDRGAEETSAGNP